ncbi:hypothetical protein QR680_006845 [Steinernema hermaphroditum]|uniref:C2H2-type domain-containing protein n=1 Tax=Steinernema hermaphroditum TaxID=289476 RepID=A0AA39HXX3_9BILA|nr:hypothetical protein QR680_006845 [Steinernema hermaphroditum]
MYSICVRRPKSGIDFSRYIPNAGIDSDFQFAMRRRRFGWNYCENVVVDDFDSFDIEKDAVWEFVTLDNGWRDNWLKAFLTSEEEVDNIYALFGQTATQGASQVVVKVITDYKSKGEYRCFADPCHELFAAGEEFLVHMIQSHSLANDTSMDNFKLPQNMAQIEKLVLEKIRLVVDESGRFLDSSFESHLKETEQKIAVECSGTSKVAKKKLFRKYYTYALVDPLRISDPGQATFFDFVMALFYIGKGEGSRCYSHLKDAAINTQSLIGTKIRLIRGLNDIDRGVFVPVGNRGSTSHEAHMRENAILSLFPDNFLTNGNFGVVKHWKVRTAIDPVANPEDFQGYGILSLIRIYNDFKFGYTPEIKKTDLGLKM